MFLKYVSYAYPGHTYLIQNTAKLYTLCENIIIIYNNGFLFYNVIYFYDGKAGFTFFMILQKSF